jgi:sugar phosphate permease
VTLGGVICAAIGVTLLADAQAWAGATLVWSALAVFIGLAMLVDAALGRGERPRREDSRSPIGGGTS